MLEVYNPEEEHTSIYETYRTDAEHPYVSGYVPEIQWISEDQAVQEEELEQLSAEIINGGPDIPNETQGLAHELPPVDDDDWWSDTAEHLDSGIKDIIITGTVRCAFVS